MKRWWLVVVLLLSVGLNLGLLGAALARRAGRPGPPPPPWQTGRGPLVDLADRLHLEGEARAAFIDRQRAFFQSTEADRRALEAARRELRGEVASATPDRAAIDRLLGAANAATDRLERAFVEHVLATRATLSPEQQRIYLDLLPRLRGFAGRPPREGRRPRPFDQRDGPPPP